MQFVAGLVLSLVVGGGVAASGFWLLRSDIVEMAQAPLLSDSMPDPLDEPPSPPEIDPEFIPEMSWMPSPGDEEPHITIFLEVRYPGEDYVRAEFSFRWSRYDEYPHDVAGGGTRIGCGVGPNGEGIGSMLSIQAKCETGGELTIKVGAHWDLAGRVSGEGSGRIVLFPEAMVENEVEEQTFGDGLVVKCWLVRPHLE